MIKLTNAEFDLVILDIMMPKMDGWAVCESMKRDPGLCDIKVIISSVRGSEEDKTIAKSSGADDYFVKPYEFPKLLEAIKSCLG